jgi:hypothetical protein
MADQVRIEPCPVCGADAKVTGPLLDVSSFGLLFDTRVYGRRTIDCPTPRCGEVCKVCRREPGDVHGPHCGDLMATKLERSHIVDRSDCT